MPEPTLYLTRYDIFALDYGSVFCIFGMLAFIVCLILTFMSWNNRDMPVQVSVFFTIVAIIGFVTFLWFPFNEAKYIRKIAAKNAKTMDEYQKCLILIVNEAIIRTEYVRPDSFDSIFSRREREDSLPSDKKEK